MADELPAPLFKDILRRYIDVLRVGRLKLNGTEVRWHTETSNELQLCSFIRCFNRALHKACSDVRDKSVLRWAPYWFCKAVSINYALMEVVLMVKEKVGTFCTIETRSEDGSPIVAYAVDIRPGPIMDVRIVWNKEGNIICYDPLTAKKNVKGTLTYLRTWFMLPVSVGFTPEYSLRMQLRRRFGLGTPRLGCRIAGRKRDAPEIVHIEEPLRSDYPLFTLDELEAVKSESRLPQAYSRRSSLAIQNSDAVHSEDIVCSHEMKVGQRDSKLSVECPRHGAELMGQLRVRLKQCFGLIPLMGQSAEIYATLDFGDGEGTAQQTRPIPASMNSEPIGWAESFAFELTSAEDLRSVLRVRFFEHDKDGENDCLGQVEVPISLALDMTGAAHTTSAVEAADDTVSGVVEARVTLELVFCPFVTSPWLWALDEDEGDNNEVCIVQVGLDGAQSGSPRAAMAPFV